MIHHYVLIPGDFLRRSSFPSICFLHGLGFLVLFLFNSSSSFSHVIKIKYIEPQYLKIHFTQAAFIILRIHTTPY